MENFGIVQVNPQTIKTGIQAQHVQLTITQIIAMVLVQAVQFYHDNVWDLLKNAGTTLPVTIREKMQTDGVHPHLRLQ